MAEILSIRRKALKNLSCLKNNNIVLHVNFRYPNIFAYFPTINEKIALRSGIRTFKKSNFENVITPFQKALLRVSKRRIPRN